MRISRIRNSVSRGALAIRSRPSFTRRLCTLPLRHAQPVAQRQESRIQILVAVLGMRFAGLIQRAASCICQG